MGQDLLLERIAERLKAQNMSERKALLRAEIGLDFVRDMRRRGHSPNVEKLAKLAKALDTPFSYFADAVTPDVDQPAGPIRLATVYVKGEVQGGVFREALEWPADRWFQVTVPVSERFPGVERFGLVVRGTSMDLVYPEGTIVIVVRFEDLDRALQNGDRVVVLHRSTTGEGFEATLKEYGIDKQGRHVLWPRSTDPEFQVPYVLSTRDSLPADDSRPAMPHVAVAGRIEDESGEPDLRIAGLVVGSYRQEDV